jgi:hypothetical protein
MPRSIAGTFAPVKITADRGELKMRLPPELREPYEDTQDARCLARPAKIASSNKRYNRTLGGKDACAKHTTFDSLRCFHAASTQCPMPVTPQSLVAAQ